MKRSKNPLGSYWRQVRRRKYFLPAASVLLFAIIGVIILFVSHAATPYASIEAESGSATGVTTTSDTKASNGSYIQFGTAGSSTPPPSSGGCTNNGVVAPCIGSATAGASGWGTPIFDDEFKNDSSLDTTKWEDNNCPFGSNICPDTDAANAADISVSGGYLNMVSNNGGSGSVITTDPNNVSPGPGFAFAYGYAEARIYVPGNSQGQIYNWPSFWLDGQSWPEDGEIDIFEGLSGQACGHYHGGTQGGGVGWADASTGQVHSGCSSSNYGGGWHMFAVNWQPGLITWYYDGIEMGSLSASQASQYSNAMASPIAPMYMILVNGGTSGPAATTTMQVQYVRVWASSNTTDVTN